MIACVYIESLLFYIPESVRQRMSRDQEIQRGKRRIASQEVSYISFFFRNELSNYLRLEIWSTLDA